PFLAVVGVERSTRNEGYILFESCFKQLLAVHALRQGDPQEQTTFGMRPLHFWRKKLLKRFQHGVAALTIDAADQLDVLVEEVVARHFIRHDLSEGGSVKIASLFQLNQFGDNVG